MGGFCDGGVSSGTSFSRESAGRRKAVRVWFICAQEARWQIVDMSNHTAVAHRNLYKDKVNKLRESPWG